MWFRTNAWKGTTQKGLTEYYELFKKNFFYDARQICCDNGKKSKDNFVAINYCFYTMYISLILITKENFSPNFIYEYKVSLPNIPECFCVSTGYCFNKTIPCGNAKVFWNIRQVDLICIHSLFFLVFINSLLGAS